MPLSRNGAGMFICFRAFKNSLEAPTSGLPVLVDVEGPRKRGCSHLCNAGCCSYTPLWEILTPSLSVVKALSYITK